MLIAWLSDTLLSEYCALSSAPPAPEDSIGWLKTMTKVFVAKGTLNVPSDGEVAWTYPSGNCPSTGRGALQPGVLVGATVNDGVLVSVKVGVRVAVFVGVAVGEFVAVVVSVGVAVAVALGVAVAVLLGVKVKVGVAVAVSVAVAVAVLLGVKV
jgi:hypothetical protein